MRILLLGLLLTLTACGDSDPVGRTDASLDTGTPDGSVDTGDDMGQPFDGGLDTGRPDIGPAVLPKWILSIDNMGENNTVHRLVRISVDEDDFGAVSDICPDIALPADVPPDNIISSLTFNSGRLYATGRGVENGDTMLEIHPCDCTATRVGPYGYEAVAGITSNGAQEMFGVSGRDDVLITIAPETGLGTLLRDLGKMWNTVGLTWTGPEDDSLWVISGATDELVLFRSSDGAEVRALDLDYDFRAVGMEYHPTTDAIYGCSNAGELLTVDPATGHVEVGPQMGIVDCNNLAAPFGAVDCVN